MKIVVCIKQVPDTKGGVKFNPDGTLDRGAMLAIMNPDDKAGLEAALKLKDEFGAEVTVLTMGLPKAEEVLREALAMGADKGILVTDRVLGGADTWATSQTIAGALRNLEYDLIITGRQAIDGDTAQVGPQISEHLDIPVISYAQNLKVEGDSVIVERQCILFFFSFLIFHSGFLQFFQCFGELLRNHARVAAQHIAFCEILQERGQLRTL